MAFYAVLTYILFPAIAYFLFGKTLEAAGNGFIVGSVVSVILWRMVGMGMVKGAWAGCKILHNYKWCLIIYALNNPVIVEKNNTVLNISKNSFLSGMWIFIWSPTSIYLCSLCLPFFPILIPANIYNGTLKVCGYLNITGISVDVYIRCADLNIQRWKWISASIKKIMNVMKVITINTVFIFTIYNAENIIPPTRLLFMTALANINE